MQASMPYAGWAAGKNPWDTCAFPPADWTHLVPEFPPLGRPLTLALPCIGLDGAGHALQRMSVPFRAVHVFDTNGSLRPLLSTVHGAQAASNFRLGPVVGDVLLEDVRQWDRVDGVVSGPPCQPDSRQGGRGRENDSRAKVLSKVTEIIADQGHKGAYFFVVEMVIGMMDHVQGQQSRYERWATDIAAQAPMYNIRTWIMNTADYLPQQRRRVYTVGIHRGYMTEVPQSPPQPLGPRLRLQDVLAPDSTVPSNQEASLSERKLMDLQVMVLLAKGDSDPGADAWLTIPLDRSLDRIWGVSCRRDGLVETLRTGDEFKWLVKMQNRNDDDEKISRCLHPIERLLLQGFPATCADILSKRDCLLHTGNAFSVPVVGAVLRQVCAELHSCGCFQEGMAIPPALPAEHTAMKVRRKIKKEALRRALLGELDAHLAYQQAANRFCRRRQGGQGHRRHVSNALLGQPRLRRDCSSHHGMAGGVGIATTWTARGGCENS